MLDIFFIANLDFWLTSKNILAIYSPTIPIEASCIPPIVATTSITVVHPSGASPPKKNFHTIRNKDIKKENINMEIPTKVVKRKGIVEKPVAKLSHILIDL